MLKLGSDLILDAQKNVRDWSWGPGTKISLDSLFSVSKLHQRLEIESWGWTINMGNHLETLTNLRFVKSWS